jgi:vacuolar-type H+-ATPase subunit E/Vma4
MVGTGPAPAPHGIADSASGESTSSTGGPPDPAESPILLAIRREGDAQGAAILAAAAQRGEELVTRAEAAADERVRRALVDAGPGIAREANRIVNEARVRAIHARTRIADDRLDGVFAAAARRLAELASNPADPRWRAALAGLADDASGFTGEGSSLAIGGSRALSTDSCRPAVAGGLQEGAPAVPDVGDPSDPDDLDCDEEIRAGVVSRSRDGRLEVDATIETRLAQARLRMADEVARILLGEDGP